MRKMSKTQSARLCVCSPGGSVGGVTGGRSERLSSSVAVTDFEVVLFPAGLFAQHPVRLVQLHKLAVQCRVGRIAIRVQLQQRGRSGSVMIR